MTVKNGVSTAHDQTTSDKTTLPNKESVKQNLDGQVCSHVKVQGK